MSVTDKQDEQSKKGYTFPVLVDKEWMHNLKAPKNSSIKHIKCMDDVSIDYSLFDMETNEMSQQSKIVDHRIVMCHFEPIQCDSDKKWIMYFANICFEWLSFAVSNVTHKPLYDMLKKKIEYMKIVLYDQIQQMNSTTRKRAILSIDTYDQCTSDYPYFAHIMKINGNDVYVLVFENECICFFQSLQQINNYLDRFMVRDLWRPADEGRAIKKPLNQQDIFVAHFVNDDLNHIDQRESVISVEETDSYDENVSNEEDESSSLTEYDEESTISNEEIGIDVSDEENDESEEEDDDDTDREYDNEDDYSTLGNKSNNQYDEDDQSYMDDIREYDDPIEQNTNEIIQNVFKHYMQKKHKPEKSYISQTPDDLVRHAKRGDIDWSNEHDRNKTMEYIHGNSSLKKSAMSPSKFKNILKNVKTNYEKDLSTDFSTSADLFNHYIKTN